VDTMNIPRFTAEASLYKTSAHYRAMAGTPHALAAAALILARARSVNVEASVDCKTFPDSITCHECNSTGPGTFNCCELRGMRNPGDSCIIVNDPNALSVPVPPRSGFPRVSTFRRGSGAQLFRGDPS
jgi:hypothetical protein